MKSTLALAFASFTLSYAQSLPDEWSQSYCTYDVAGVCQPGAYSFGFAVDNYTIYSHDPDTVDYDTRRFDLYARLGVVKSMEIEVKYSSPTAGVIAGKYQFLDGAVSMAFKLGCGYMKGTRSGFITDYVFDFYPTLIVTRRISKGFGIYVAPRIIYSIHQKDTREHSTREPRHIFQYGYGIGLAIGRRLVLLPESNWLFGNNEGVTYHVNQFGIGVTLLVQ